MSNSTNFSCSIPDIRGPTNLFTNVTVALYVVVIIISLIGNSLILLVVYHNKSMQTVTNLLICNCSVADLLITILPTVWKIADMLEFHGRWPIVLPPFLCVCLILSIYLSVAATIITLMVISVDRFYCILFPYKKHVTKQTLIVIVPLIWLAAFTFASPVTFIQKVKHVDDYGYACVEEWPAPFTNASSTKHYTLVLFVCLYGTPLLLTTVLYVLIGCKLSTLGEHRRNMTVQNRQLQVNNNSSFQCCKLSTLGEHRRNMTVQNRQLQVNNNSSFQSHRTTSTLLSSIRNGNASNRSSPSAGTTTRAKPSEVNAPSGSRDDRTRRVVRMLVAIVVAFAVSWLPVNIIQFLNYFHPYFIRCPMSMPHWTYTVAFFMQYANSAINPIIYFAFSKTYFQGLKRLLDSLRRK